MASERLGAPVERLTVTDGVVSDKANPDKRPVNAIDKFIATTDGVALVRAFTAIKDAKVRRAIVDLVQRIAGV